MGHKSLKPYRALWCFLVVGIAALSLLFGGCATRLSKSNEESEADSSFTLKQTHESGASDTGTTIAETTSETIQTKKATSFVSTEITAPTVPKWDDIQPDISRDSYTTVSKKGGSISATTTTLPNSSTTEGGWMPGVW
ncbi:MAG: hypothetical protein PHH84_03575 [Oscillospiraceae bacterium]|nr:hypothetical protein [Oscillospiraceae bacterium]MDD4413942.1 hypothetical protein [Oscillospiraceae bacterium]